MAEDRKPSLDEVLIGGREARPIIIADYDPAWAERFQQERARITTALGRLALRIEHIGSTSVPGLAAKPIVDILVTVEDVEGELFDAPLVSAGYVLRVREPGHRMYRTPERDVHVHLYRDDAPECDRYLVLRDWLREHEEDRARYAAVKRELSQQSWGDMNEYADAKTGVVHEILARADAARR